ncbi:helix-turn-helix transcriptional regulator [Hyphomicrobium sp. 1Nfss2.1]|uniref:helix-turn-helix transcriptional regulator n=1 Tax=Hyphomicrobium sp. 1Nfss2.1 TaxID=3413936 RepID=UPI003C7A8FCE
MTHTTSALLTTKEAARLVRLSPRTLERHRVQATGPRYRKAGPGIRARVLYAVEDLNSWIGDSFRSTSEYL